jgi:hypothetical protein
MSQPKEPEPDKFPYPFGPQPSAGTSPPHGQQFPYPAVVAETPAGPAARRRGRWGPVGIAAALALIAVALVFAFVGSTAGNGPDDAVIAQYEAYQKKDYGTVYDLTCKRIKQQVPRQLFVDSAARRGAPSVQDLVVRRVRDSTNGAAWKSVDVALTGPDGQTRQSTVEVVDEDGWKVCSA